MASVPPASDAAALQRLRTQRRRDTRPELALRSVLHRRGLRYRVQQRPLPELRRTADVVFRSARVAVEVRGCFWHACPAHGATPKRNGDWWATKLARNAERDASTRAALEAAGWALVVVWEHDDPERAADEVERVVRSRRAAPTAAPPPGAEPGSSSGARRSP